MLYHDNIMVLSVAYRYNLCVIDNTNTRQEFSLNHKKTAMMFKVLAFVQDFVTKRV